MISSIDRLKNGSNQEIPKRIVLNNRFPELRLNSDPVALPEEVRSPPRASCYDNVHDLRPVSEQVNYCILAYRRRTLADVLKLGTYLKSWLTALGRGWCPMLSCEDMLTI